MICWVIQIINSDQRCWIAPWKGDPGRTEILGSAQMFEDEMSAMVVIRKILAVNDRHLILIAQRVMVMEDGRVGLLHSDPQPVEQEQPVVDPDQMDLYTAIEQAEKEMEDESAGEI